MVVLAVAAFWPSLGKGSWYRFRNIDGKPDSEKSIRRISPCFQRCVGFSSFQEKIPLSIFILLYGSRIFKNSTNGR